MRGFKWTASCLSIVIACTLMASIAMGQELPDSFSVVEGTQFALKSGVPIKASVQQPGGDVVEASALRAGNSYDVNLNLLGVVPVKTVKVNVVEQQMVVPCGTPFGIKMYTDGVLVIGLSSVDTKNGNQNPAEQAGLRKGDVIVSMNGSNVLTNAEVAQIVEASNGESMDVLVRRQGEEFHMQMQPQLSSSENRYKLGAWVRDSSAGIGTLTFYDPETMVFGGLGHPICDVDTGETLPLMTGGIVSAVIGGVKMGVAGTPGELRGTFKPGEDMGTLHQNCDTGVYGILKNVPAQQEAVSVAMRQQVQPGKAQILTTISGETPKYYDIEIEKINYDINSPTRNMVIKITDEELIAQAGGIVQGMSGSPILQNGMLVGAVTHVFINNPEQGYAIFAENMMKTAVSTADNVLNDAA